MANSKVINTRILSKVDTSAEWTKVNPVLLKNEKIIVDFGAGAHPRYREKIGDGVSKYSALPFTDENNISLEFDHKCDDDDIVVLSCTSTHDTYATNKVKLQHKLKATHKKEGPTSKYTSGNTTVNIGPGDTKNILIPQLTVNEYGHVTGISDEQITISVPNVSDIVETVDYLGTIGSVNELTTTATKGDFYRAITEFTSGSVTIHVGDLVIAEIANPTKNIYESSEDALADSGWVVIHCHNSDDALTFDDYDSKYFKLNDDNKVSLNLSALLEEEW